MNNSLILIIFNQLFLFCQEILKFILFLFNKTFMLKQFTILLFVIVAQSTVYSQAKSSQLIDSLTFASDDIVKSRLSGEIAWELRNSNWKRTLQYLAYSEKAAKDSKSDEALAQFYIVAADIYDEKDVLDVTLEYYLK